MTSTFQKYALVTGGNKGIGFAICEGLLAKGFEVILAARSPRSLLLGIAQLKNDSRIKSERFHRVTFIIHCLCSAHY
jgi:NAD(P)-dependent dehydrogenase (short-subunit alcohol dehydrogenase family)